MRKILERNSIGRKRDQGVWSIKESKKKMKRVS